MKISAEGERHIDKETYLKVICYSQHKPRNMALEAEKCKEIDSPPRASREHSLANALISAQ